jgi:hypothetical protein
MDSAAISARRKPAGRAVAAAAALCLPLLFENKVYHGRESMDPRDLARADEECAYDSWVVSVGLQVCHCVRIEKHAPISAHQTVFGPGACRSGPPGLGPASGK